MNASADLLFVDPTHLFHKMVDQLCSKHDATCRHANSTLQALGMIAERTPSAIVAGLEQSDFTAQSLVGALRNDSRLSAIPIAVLTTESAAGLSGMYQPDRLIRRDTEWLSQLTDFLIPILEAPGHDQATDDEPPRVLLVEDSASTQRLAARILHLAGCQVTAALDGRSALEMLAVDPFDIVLMDIEMPIMDGREAIGQIRDEGNQIPVFALTAHSEREFLEEAEQLGFDGMCAKPIRQDNLIALIDKGMAMRGRRQLACD